MATVGAIGIVLVVAILGILVSRRLWQPAVVGEIVAGIALGPSLLGLLPGHLPERLFPTEIRSAMSTVAQVGVLLFLFTIGWSFSPSELRGQRRSSLVIWLSSLGLPLVLGATLALTIHDSYGTVGGQHVDVVDFVVYISVAMSVTAFPVLARIVVEQGLESSRIGTLALALAAADDVVAWFLLAVVAALATTGASGGFVPVLLWSAVYLAVMALVVRPLLAAVARRVPARALPYAAPAAAAAVFLSAWVTSTIGIHAIFGAFALGMVMPRDSEALRTAVAGPLQNAATLLMPVFFVVTGLSVDLTTLGGSMLPVTVIVVAVACLSKLGGVAVPARLLGMSGRDAFALGLLMNTRGLTQLIVLDVGRSLGLLSSELFAAMVLMAVVTTAMASPLLRLVLPTPSAPAPRRARSADVPDAAASPPH